MFLHVKCLYGVSLFMKKLCTGLDTPILRYVSLIGRSLDNNYSHIVKSLLPVRELLLQTSDLECD